MRPSWKGPLLWGGRAVNAGASWALGRKLVAVDQRRAWRRRAANWRAEVAAVEGDPYYAELDARLVKTLAALPSARRLLEVGCFTGYRLAKVRAALADALVLGLDMVFEALRVGRDGASGACRLVNGDAAHLPLRSGAVDCCYTIACLTHVPERRVGAVLDEMLRVARRYLVLIEVYDRLMRFRQRLRVWGWEGGYCHPYEALLARRGLTPLRVEGLYDGAGHPRYTLFVYAKGSA